MSYMDKSNNWGGGYASTQQQTANKVDHVADKITFAISMITNNLISIEGMEKELIIISTGTTPPRPEQLKGIASRLETTRNQVREGLEQIKAMATQIDTITDTIQNNPGW